MEQGADGTFRAQHAYIAVGFDTTLQVIGGVMRSILIVLLMAGVAWGQGVLSPGSIGMPNYEFTMPALIKDGIYEFKNDEFMAVPNPTTDKVVQIPKMEDFELTGQGNVYHSEGGFVEFKGVETYHALIISLGPNSYRNICIEKEGDKRRCVNLNWLYLLMVAAGIQEDCK